MTPEQKQQAADLCPRMAEVMGMQWSAAGVDLEETGEYLSLATGAYPSDLLAFAMYVQAWAARREKPWLPLMDTGFVKEDVETVLRFVCGHRSTRPHVCDFTDEISHALAIVRCGLEIAKLGGAAGGHEG